MHSPTNPFILCIGTALLLHKTELCSILGLGLWALVMTITEGPQVISVLTMAMWVCGVPISAEPGPFFLLPLTVPWGINAGRQNISLDFLEKLQQSLVQLGQLLHGKV
jgi:hypothetical protein